MIISKWIQLRACYSNTSQVFRAFMRVQLLSRQKADEKVVDRITPR